MPGSLLHAQRCLYRQQLRYPVCLPTLLAAHLLGILIRACPSEPASLAGPANMATKRDGPRGVNRRPELYPVLSAVALVHQMHQRRSKCDTAPMYEKDGCKSAAFSASCSMLAPQWSQVVFPVERCTLQNFVWPVCAKSGLCGAFTVGAHCSSIFTTRMHDVPGSFPALVFHIACALCTCKHDHLK